MRLKALIPILFLASFAGAQTTTTVTGTIKDLTQANVTSGKVTFTLMPSRDTTISGLARFSPQQVVCLINAAGLIKAQDGVSVCTLTMNTALLPSGTYYRVDIWPYNVKTSSFTFYAVLSTYDWSTVVPTPTTSPAQNFVDIFSNQMIAGNKTWTGTHIFQGATSFTGSLTLPGLTGLQVQVSDSGSSANTLDLFDTAGGATNPHKFFRVGSTGTFQLYNNLFNTVIFSVTDGGVATVKGIQIDTKIAADGSGFKHKRVASCTTAAGANSVCNTTVTWGSAFADANYTASCTADGLGVAGSYVAGINSKVAASVLVQISNGAAGGAFSATLNCIAVHD